MFLANCTDKKNGFLKFLFLSKLMVFFLMFFANWTDEKSGFLKFLFLSQQYLKMLENIIWKIK